ncbi:MAG: TolC family protein [Bacteroides sp.]
MGSPQSSTERHGGKAGKKGWKKWLGKRKRKSSVKLGVLCVAFFCIPTALQAQSSPLLERYRSMALAYSHDLKAAEKNISASLELEKSARADLKPKLSAGGQFNYTGKPMKLSLDLPALESPLNFGGQNLGYGASVSLLQPLYTGGMLLESIKMAQHQQSLAKNQQEMIQAMICYQVDIQYWNTVARRELVSVATAFRHSIASLVRTIKERVDAGLTDRQDLLMAEVKLNDAEYQLLQAQNNLETGRMALNSLIGEALSADTEIETRLPAVCAEEAAAPGNAGSRPELRMADDRIRLAESSCKLNDAKFRPQFYIGIDGSCSSPGYNFNKDLDPNYAVYAKVSVPLWEWGKRKSVKRASTFKVGMAQDNRRRVEDDLTLEVQTARLSLAQSAERIRLSQNSLEKADENERQALERYTEGRTSLIDVIEAQTYRQQAQQLSVQARAGGQSDAAALTKALNGYGRVIEKL